MDFSIDLKLSKLAKKLLLLQRNNLLSPVQIFLRKKFGRFLFTNFFVHFFQKKSLNILAENIFKSDFDTFKKYLPRNPKNILDIGCGLGMINIFIKKFYKHEINFFLVDKNKIDLKIKYGFSDLYESYNLLSETKNILQNNGIDQKHIFLKDADRDISIGNRIDFVISLKSMGYHYPFENYLNKFKQNFDKNTIFCFDLSLNKYTDLNYLRKFFENVTIIYSEESIHPLKRIICTGLKEY